MTLSIAEAASTMLEVLPEDLVWFPNVTIEPYLGALLAINR